MNFAQSATRASSEPNLASSFLVATYSTQTVSCSYLNTSGQRSECPLPSYPAQAASKRSQKRSIASKSAIKSSNCKRWRTKWRSRPWKWPKTKDLTSLRDTCPEATTRVTSRPSLCTHAPSTSASSARKSTSVAWSTVRWPSAKKREQAKRTSAAKSANSRLLEPVRLFAQSTKVRTLTGNATSAAQSPCSTALERPTSARDATMSTQTTRSETVAVWTALLECLTLPPTKTTRRVPSHLAALSAAVRTSKSSRMRPIWSLRSILRTSTNAERLKRQRESAWLKKRKKKSAKRKRERSERPNRQKRERLEKPKKKRKEPYKKRREKYRRLHEQNKPKPWFKLMKLPKKPWSNWAKTRSWSKKRSHSRSKRIEKQHWDSLNLHRKSKRRWKRQWDYL